MYLPRKGTETDASAVFELRTAAIRHQCAGHYPAETIELWTEGNAPSLAFSNFVSDSCYVIEIGGAVVASGAVDLSTGQVDAVFVDPRHIHKGVGSAMMRFLETTAIAAGLQRLNLESTLNAEEFYRANGFSSERPSKYHSPRGFTMDCIVMTKRIARENLAV
jgi:GNAT superfamily N-acetyltransferase